MALTRLSLATAHATLIAADSAANPAYDEAPASWQGLNTTSGENPAGMDNGGFGFNVWDFAGGYHNPTQSPYGELNHFIDGVDFPASSYNALGARSFGLTNANQPFFGYTARATRTFAPLQIGETITVDFDNPLHAPLDQFSPSGFLLRLNTGGGPVIDSDPIPGVSERFGIFSTSNFNGSRWFTTDSDEFTDTALPSSETSVGATFQFTLTGNDAYVAELVRLSDSQVLFSRTGALKNAGAGGIDTLEIALYGNGSGEGPGGTEPTGRREFFFNNLRIESTLGANADFNQDGLVDGRDFLRWQRGVGTLTGAELSQGDANGDGAVNAADLDAWEHLFGRSTTSIGAPAPEPAAWALAACGASTSLWIAHGKNRPKQRPSRMICP